MQCISSSVWSCPEPEYLSTLMFTEDLHLDLISSLHSVFLYSYLFQLLQLILSYCRISQSQYLTPSAAYFCCTSPNYCIDKTYSLEFTGVSGVQGFFTWRKNLITKWLEKIELGSCYLWFKTHLLIEFLGPLMPSEKLLQLLEQPPQEVKLVTWYLFLWCIGYYKD